MSQIPGITAKHAIITPTCRLNHSDIGAFEVAISRLREEYVACLNQANHKANFHLALTVERQGETRLEGPISDTHRLALAEALADKWDARATVLTSDRESMRDDRLKASVLRDCSADLSAVIAMPTLPKIAR